jgi:nanoRNase/pAp phosphatase (c-di-AMP/oligoRNAs hydrolase)
MQCKVLFHDNCFDGAASAAVFSRFYLERVHPGAALSYEGLSHKAGAAPIDDRVFTGEENAIVDFRYSQNPRLTWWFDHHQSAFQQPGDEQHFKADHSGKKFHDPKRKSCTCFLAEIAERQFGFDAKPLAELLHWAEIIDGALFESPKMAVELVEPALQLMTVLENNRDAALGVRVIGELQSVPLAELAAQPHIRDPFRALMAKHQKNIELVRQRAQMEKGVVFFDLAGDGLESINKFISYYLYPDARYTVWVGCGPQRAKISVGSNPWHPELRTHDLSRIAERYGGGGHPVVAGVSFDAQQLPAARKAAAEILSELRG